jgi:hypothetical protein
LGAFPALRAGNRAFRSNLFACGKKDFRCNHPPFEGVSNRKPIIVGAHRALRNAPEDGRFPIGMDCSGRYRAPGIPGARPATGSEIAYAISLPIPYARIAANSGTVYAQQAQCRDQPSTQYAQAVQGIAVLRLIISVTFLITSRSPVS